eukprot:3769311-Rhodomonas_salina.2
MHSGTMHPYHSGSWHPSRSGRKVGRGRYPAATVLYGLLEHGDGVVGLQAAKSGVCQVWRTIEVLGASRRRWRAKELS